AVAHAAVADVAVRGDLAHLEGPRVVGRNGWGGAKGARLIAAVPLGRPLARGPVDPHVGDRIQPRLELLVQVVEVREASPLEEAPLHVAHTPLHLALDARPV